jgi:hypothetical protein
MEVSKWRYKGTEEQHIGPMAEEFKALFGLGIAGDDQHISTVDVAGVALRAIQVLTERLEASERKIAELEAKLKSTHVGK